MAKAPPKKVEEPEAEGEVDLEAVSAAAVKKKKMILLIVIGVVLLVLSIGGSIAAMKFLGGKKAEAPASEESKEGEHAEADPAHPEKPAVTYFPLEPPFLANFIINGRPHYLQLSISVASRDKDSLEAMQKHMPLIRNRIVLLLSGEQFEILRSRAGKDALQLKLLNAIKEILKKETDKDNVEKVLFTNFVMQ